MIHERRRITYALLLSLLIHTSLLSLTFRGQGLWPLWLAFPWQDRWIEAPDLRVTLVRVPSTAPEPGVAPISLRPSACACGRRGGACDVFQLIFSC